MGMSLREEFATIDPTVASQWIAAQDTETIAEIIREEWWWIARPEQIPPTDNHFIFLYLAGRGAGKTRSGAEWIVERCEQYPLDASGAPTEHLVVAESLGEAKKVCIEGPSGIIRVLQRKGYKEGRDYSYNRSGKPRILLKRTGVKIHFLGADDPDVGRGLNLASLWLDEIVAWSVDAKVAWDEGLMPALRSDVPGDHPRCYVTTTPKPIPLLREWLKRNDGSVAVSRGTTFDNKANLSTHYLDEAYKRYEGTRIGRQELYGEMLDDIEGALFSAVHIRETRVDIGPIDVSVRAMAVDPSLTGGEDGDEMGVVVAVRDSRRHIYILDDASVRLVGRDAALHCWRVFERYECDVLIYENNLGHAWLHTVLEDAYRELQREGFFPDHTNPPLKPVRSYQGKQLRAEPVSMRYEQRTIHMVGTFPELEEQLVGWDPLSSRDSPDRLDAFVHVCRFLMEGEGGRGRIVSPKDKILAPLSNGPSERGALGRAKAYVRRNIHPSG